VAAFSVPATRPKAEFRRSGVLSSRGGSDHARPAREPSAHCQPYGSPLRYESVMLSA